jgi:hypothetical protein
MNSIELIYKLMEYIKFQTNISKDNSERNINLLFKQFCETHKITFLEEYV